MFADGFNGPLDGTGAGVLAYGGNVYYTCIPHLWQLQELIVIAKEDIGARDLGQSGMPELVKHLSKRDLRGLVEYLSSLK